MSNGQIEIADVAGQPEDSVRKPGQFVVSRNYVFGRKITSR
jgi:hypothetical protein